MENKFTAVTNNVLFHQRKEQFVTDRSFVTTRLVENPGSAFQQLALSGGNLRYLDPVTSCSLSLLCYIPLYTMDNYKEIKCYRCGDKFGRRHVKSCKAMNRMCFSCNKVGHLSYVCRTKTVAAVRTVHVFVRKSSKRRLRDQLRYTEFKSRKSEMAELPFNNSSSTEFAEFNAMTTCVQPVHTPKHNKVASRIGALKVTNSQLQATNKDLSKSLETCQIKNKALEKKILAIELQNSKEMFRMENENQKLQNKRKSEEGRLNAVKEQLRIQEAAYSETIAKLNKEVESLKSKMIENERISQDFESFLRDQHEDEMKELVTRHKKEIENLRASMEPASASACAPNYNAAKSRQRRGRGGTRHRGRGTQSVKTPTITRMIIGDDSEPHEQRKYFPEKCYCPQEKSDGPGSYHMHFGPQCKIDRPADGIPKVSCF